MIFGGVGAAHTTKNHYLHTTTDINRLALVKFIRILSGGSEEVFLYSTSVENAVEHDFELNFGYRLDIITVISTKDRSK